MTLNEQIKALYRRIESVNAGAGQILWAAQYETLNGMPVVKWDGQTLISEPLGLTVKLSGQEVGLVEFLRGNALYKSTVGNYTQWLSAIEYAEGVA